MPEPIVKIDGVTVDAIPGTLDIQATIGNRATLNVGVWSTSGGYRPVVGKSIEVFEATTKLWAGSVDEVFESSISEGQPTGRRYSIRGVSWEQYLDRRYCYGGGVPLRYSRNYEFTANLATDTLTTVVAHGRSNGDKVRVKAHANGVLVAPLSATVEYFVISAAATTLQLSLTLAGAAINLTIAGYLEQILITYRAGQIVAALLVDGASSEPIGTANIDLGAVIDTVIFDSDVTVSEAIAQLAIASNYVWWIDEERELYFKPRTFEVAPFALTSAGGNYRNFSARRTREDKVNSALMRVDMEQIGYEDETFVGNGVATSWTLAYAVGEMVRVEVNADARKFAIWLADDDSSFYYELGGKTIRQDSDDAVLISSQTLRVVYRKFGANTINQQDAADIAATATLEGNAGIYAMPFERGGVSQGQALLDGQAIVEAQKTNAAEIQYDTDQNIESTCHTLRPGQLQTITNSFHAISVGTYLIREITVRDVMGRWLQFSVKAISTARLGGAIEFWKAMGGGGGLSGAVGTGSGGSSSASTPPNNVTITSADYEYIDAYKVRVRLYWTAPVVLADFVGVHVFEEDPDVSTITSTPMDGTQAMDGTSNLGGEWDPIDRGKGVRSPFVLELVAAKVSVTHRFYLSSYSESEEAALVRATLASPTPSITLAIAAPVYQSGVEYAQLATGQTATLEYDESQVASPKYRIRFGWVAPSVAPAAWQRGFGGVQIVYEYADGRRANGPTLAVNEIDATSGWKELFVGSSVIRFWFVSFDNSEEPRVNTIVYGVTPSASVTVVWPLASRAAIAPYADNVAGFDVSNARYTTTGAGQKALLIDWAWTRPVGAAALARWGGAVIYLFIPGEAKPYQITGAELGVSGVMEFSQFPQAAQNWVFWAISQDNNNNQNTTPAAPAVGTPTDTISVSPPTAGATGTEFTAHVTGAAFAVASVVASDGTTTQRISATFTRPTDVTWGGVEGRVYDGATLIAKTPASASPWRIEVPNPTTSTTLTVKLVSFDVNGQTNTEQAGTPQGTVIVGSTLGTLDIRKFLPASTDNFAIVGSFLQIRTGVAVTVDAGGLLRVAVSGIDSTLIATGAVLEAAIATSAITVTKIATDAVTTPKIFSGAITTAKIAALAVTAAEIAAGAIVAGKIAALTIVAGDIATDAIIASKILAGSITTVKIAANAISSDKLDATVINVGGGGSKPGKFNVFNSAGASVGFIGTEGSGIDGAWFQTLSVGGSSYGTGVIKANSSGQITVEFVSASIANNKILISQTTYDPTYTTAGIRIHNGVFPAASSDTTWFISRGMVVYGSGNYQSNYYAVTVNRDPTSSGAGEVVVYGNTPSSYIRLSGSDGRCRADGGFQVSGSVGVTGSSVLVSGINTNLVTINYKDHASNNQTVSFLAFSSTVAATLTFAGGIRV